MENSESKKPKFKVDKKHIQGFIAGVLLSVLIFVGVFGSLNPGFFFGSMVSNEINDNNFEEAVIKSDRPVLIYYYAPWMSTCRSYGEVVEDLGKEYSSYFKTVRVDIETCPTSTSRYSVLSVPTLILVENGMYVSRKIGVSTKKQIFDWIWASRISWEFHEDLTPVVNNAPTFYFMFTKQARLDRDPSRAPDFCLSEILLLPYNFTPYWYMKCDGTIIDIWTNSGLYSLLGNTCGTVDDPNKFKLPDLTGKEPLDGLSYYICSNGSYPSEPFVASSVVDEIKYFCHTNTTIDLTIGDIKLAKDVDPAKYGSVLIPCDGRELNVNEYVALYSLIGTKFGGDGKTTFRIPDLTGKSPIEGAQYYIVINGIYPSAG